MSNERKEEFIVKLAEFLVNNQVGKRIALQAESQQKTIPPGFPQWASEWAQLRSATPLFGYPSVEEAVEQLKEFLG